MAKDNQNFIYKSEDKWVNGVIGGLSEHYDVDKTTFRLIVLIGMMLGLSAPIILTYIALMFFMTDPEDSEEDEKELSEDD